LLKLAARYEEVMYAKKRGSMSRPDTHAITAMM
jgi:hypothetical protein